MEKLISRNLQLEHESQEKDNKYIDLYDDNNQMHDDMLELQEQLEEAGFLGDNFSDEGMEEDGGSGGKGGPKIPGKKNAKKVMKTLGKLLKRKKKDKEKKDKGLVVVVDEVVEEPI